MAESTASDHFPMGTLIPFLPDDVAMICLAFVPRQYHPVLSAVSKPIRSVVSSPEFFALRAHLNRTETVFHLRLRSPFEDSPRMFALYRNNPDAADNTTPSRSRLVPLPPLPLEQWNYFPAAALGHKIYVMTGTTYDCPTKNDTWVLDCRTSTWSRGPPTAAWRVEAKAVPLGGKIYLVGGNNESDPFAEVLDPETHSWEAVPEPLVGGHRPFGRLYHCVEEKGMIWARVGQVDLRFDPRTQKWSGVEYNPPAFFLHESLCVAGEALLGVSWRSKRISWFDKRRQTWKDVDGVVGKLPDSSSWCWTGVKVINSGGRLVVLALQKRGFQEEMFEGWCAEVVKTAAEGGSSGGVRGEVLWLENVLSMTGLDSDRLDDLLLGTVFSDWDCFAICL